MHYEQNKTCAKPDVKNTFEALLKARVELFFSEKNQNPTLSQIASVTTSYRKLWEKKKDTFIEMNKRLLKQSQGLPPR